MEKSNKYIKSVTKLLDSKYKKRRDKSKLKGDINDGGPELYLRTSAGSINIRED